MMVRVGLLLFSSIAVASSPCDFVDLRARGGTMEHIKPASQGPYGVCYAAAADQVYDALRAHFATREELNFVLNQPSSLGYTALAFESKRSIPNPHFISDKTDALEVPVPADSWRPWLQSMMTVARHVNISSDEAALMSLFAVKLRTLDLLPVKQDSGKKRSRFYFEGGDECRTIARLLDSGSCTDQDLNQTIDRIELDQLIKRNHDAILYNALANEDTDNGLHCASTWSRIEDLRVISERGESNSRTVIVDQCHKQPVPTKMRERMGALRCRTVTIEPLLRQAYRKNASIAGLKSSLDNFKSEVATTFDHDLHIGAPVGTSICAAPLMNAKYSRNIDGSCGPHAVVTIGQRPIGNRCQYLVRNSWGPKTCDIYASSLKPGCEANGDLWLDSDKYLNLIHGVDSVSAGF